MRGCRYTSKLGKVPRQGTRGPIHHDLLLFHSSFGHEPSATHDLIEAKEYKEMHKTRSSDPLKMELLYDCGLHLASLSGAADDGGHLSLLYQCSYNRKLGRNLCKQLSEAQEKLKFELVVKVSPPRQIDLGSFATPVAPFIEKRGSCDFLVARMFSRSEIAYIQREEPLKL